MTSSSLIPTARSGAMSPAASACGRSVTAIAKRAIARSRSVVPALRAVGMGDEEIIDLLHAVAIFGWANRLMQNLGEPVGAAAA